MKSLRPAALALAVTLAPAARPALAQALSQTQAPQPAVSLEEMLESARLHQPQLRQAHAGTQAARARVDGARAPLLPQLTAQYSDQLVTANAFNRPGSGNLGTGGTGTGGTGTGGTGTGGIGGTSGTSTGSFKLYNYFSGSITANQLIYDFGQSTGRYRSSQAAAAAFADTERATELAISLNVRVAFFSARANKSLALVARSNLDNQRRHLDQTVQFVNAGTHPEIDLATARTAVANAEVQLINAENQYGLSKATLNQAAGVERASDYDVTDDSMPEIAHEDEPLEALLELALKARPEVASLEEQVRAQQLTLRSIEGNFAPALGASAGLTQGGTAFDHLGWNVSAGLTLTWQIFQGGLTTAQVHEAEANVGSLAAQLDSLRLQLRLEVEQTRLAVRATKSTVRATEDALKSAREQLRLADGRFETGVGNAVEQADAQLALTNAAAQRVQADYQLATARAQLLKALGQE